ncbi:hypothetical protein CcI49_16925 [Frankia sp. CcI49]|uniref:hypothetical protein n=1 Tax=unclassified Frankia TaxID=2632575 RepID=UPI0006CA2DA7|nr:MULTISPECIES: hypothetical protein [unclassified Frankia]KPM53317.1 hypothetical protein ACG83_21490 [Frankia sp. R43]ONH59630.1 hypothetical protein CcI49_16925 [Frankia sp. CcI49]
MTTPSPLHPPSEESWRHAQAVMGRKWLAPTAYAVVFVDTSGSPTSVVGTFPGPMSAEMYGRIVGVDFRVVRVHPSSPPP